VPPLALPPSPPLRSSPPLSPLVEWKAPVLQCEAPVLQCNGARIYEEGNKLALDTWLKKEFADLANQSIYK
jgi:hypothetical protein